MQYYAQATRGGDVYGIFCISQLKHDQPVVNDLLLGWNSNRVGCRL